MNKSILKIETTDGFSKSIVVCGTIKSVSFEFLDEDSDIKTKDTEKKYTDEELEEFSSQLLDLFK